MAPGSTPPESGCSTISQHPKASNGNYAKIAYSESGLT
jgi:hypothetical protein